MLKLKFTRRHFLFRMCKLGIAVSFFLGGIARSDERPQSPSAPSFGTNKLDPDKVKIDEAEYERWLFQVQEAAKKLAIDSGVTYESSAEKEFNINNRKTLTGNGYNVPKPPTNLRVF